MTDVSNTQDTQDATIEVEAPRKRGRKPLRSKVLTATPRGHRATVQAVANKSGVAYLTARKHLIDLVAEGVVIQESVKQTGKRGRPARLYQRVG